MKRLATTLAFTATSPSRFYRNANTSIQNHRSDIPLVISNVISPKNFSSDSNGTRPLVVCGPSGVGKGTLIDLLMKRFPPIESRDQIGFSVSHTTRQPREGEVDGHPARQAPPQHAMGVQPAPQLPAVGELAEARAKEEIRQIHAQQIRLVVPALIG